MATLDEMERAFRADPGLADLLAALDRSAAAVASAGLTAGDLTADLPAIRAHVARVTYGDTFMDELRHDVEAPRATDRRAAPADDERVALDLDDLLDRDDLAALAAQDPAEVVVLDADTTFDDTLQTPPPTARPEGGHV